MTATVNAKSEKTDSVERILQAATQLFADFGFDGVTTRQIAAAADLNMATVHHHVGTKRQLYDKVLARLFQEERKIVDPFLEKIDDSVLQNSDELRAVLKDLLDTLVDLLDQSPARARLYMRRWLEGASDSGDEHERDTLAFYETLGGVLARAQIAGSINADANIALMLRGFDWLINGYFVTGPIASGSLKGDPHAPENLRQFKKFLNAYVTCTLGL